MHASFITAALLSLAATVSAHSQLLNIQGEAGSPASVGFEVDDSISRNCTGISPCQQDATIIRDAEINAKIATECGRTEEAGNIDVTKNTEAALAAGAVTSVKAGTVLDVTVHQVNADGAGPYVCDIDTGSDSGVISQNLTVTNNVAGVNGFSDAKTEDFVMNVAMPADLACTGGSTGNICTVRCRNNAVAGPFGGCFAVQQTDATASTGGAASKAGGATAASGTAKAGKASKAGTAATASGAAKAGKASTATGATTKGAKSTKSGNKAREIGLRWARRALDSF